MLFLVEIPDGFTPVSVEVAPKVAGQWAIMALRIDDRGMFEVEAEPMTRRFVVDVDGAARIEPRVPFRGAVICESPFASLTAAAGDIAMLFEKAEVMLDRGVFEDTAGHWLDLDNGADVLLVVDLGEPTPNVLAAVEAFRAEGGTCEVTLTQGRPTLQGSCH